ncbi:MAG: EAL domain-containing protein, partial [Gammaproteobacteria bacterium]
AQQELEAKVAERTAELTAANRVLREREAELAEAQQIARMGSWIWDIPSNTISWSNEVYRILGCQPKEFEPSYPAFLERVHPDDRDAVQSAVKASLQRRQPYSVDHRIVLPDGSSRIVHEQARVDYDADGTPLRMTGTLHDITEAKAIERQLEHMAYHDPLTGLPNRALLRERLAQAVARSRRSGRLMALLFLDLDRFKNVNDSLGHAVGDRLLVQVAERLATHMRAEDTLARLGGDEFTVLLEDLDNAEQAATVARKLHQALTESFHIDAREIFVAGSVGISLYPGDGEDVDTLMKHADAAMYRAKELGRGGDQFFSRDLSERAHEHLALEMALRRALERDELCLYYQPIIELASGRIAGFEALVRWQHPERGLLLPGDFIPLAEETGLCVDIGHHVLRSACEQSRAWRTAGVPALRVMVNLSPRQFSEGDLPGEIETLLAANGLRAQCLGLEITEHVLVKDDDAMNGQLGRLREMGVPVAIDDFGKGHSSLAYLKRLAITTLKIDRAFVRDLTTDVNDTAIVEAIIAVGHTLDLVVVAEGVETAEQAEQLRARACDFAQGFYYSRPVPAAEVPALIRARGVAES